MVLNHPCQSQQRDNSFDRRGWSSLKSRILHFQSRYNYVDKNRQSKLFTRLISTHKAFQFVWRKALLQRTVPTNINNTGVVWTQSPCLFCKITSLLASCITEKTVFLSLSHVYTSCGKRENTNETNPRRSTTSTRGQPLVRQPAPPNRVPRSYHL